MAPNQFGFQRRLEVHGSR
uniref:Uncharacterized protein n=1 Tax=Arundo donax TaxID=35708 RepID=A0A0A9AKC3_ARUDO